MSHKTIELEASTSLGNVSSTSTPTVTDENRQKDSVIDPTIPNSKSTDEVNKSEIQAKFREQFSRLLSPNAQTDKV